MTDHDPQLTASPIPIGTVRDAKRVMLAEIEQFLYAEAALLDDHRFEEWLSLFTEDARYEVPAVDRPAGEVNGKVMLISDNLFRLRARTLQIGNENVLGEVPPARTRRMISNVRVLANDGTTIKVAANFAIHRFRSERMEVYVGSHEQTLDVSAGSLRIKMRRSTLEHEAIRPHGKLTIIL